MSDPSTHARRVAVPAPEGLLALDRYDYADAFAIEVAPDDPRSAEEFTRDALERAPAVIRRTIRVAWRGLLRFRLGPHPSEDHVLGMAIRDRAPDVLHLAAEGPLLRPALLVRRTPQQVVLATYLSYVRPRPARLVWAGVGVLHRRLAVLLLERTAALPVERKAHR